MTSILDRVRTSLARMRAEKLQPRAIYLDAPDFAELSAAIAPPGTELERLHFDDVEVRRTKGKARSMIYSIHGVTRAVRKRA